MQTTIFCSFRYRQQADAAARRVRTIGGVEDIYYILDDLHSTPATPAASVAAAPADTSGSPVHLRILCRHNARHRVTDALAVHGAYAITAKP